MMDFSGSAGATSDFDILPKGLLAWAYLKVRGIKTSATPSKYLDVELTIAEGQPYAGRKLWDIIGDPHFAGNSEEFRKMGTIAITRILEAGRGAGPNNAAGYQIAGYEQLDGLKVAIKVGVEAGKDGHDDKNRVAEWLTPNPNSQSGFKGYDRLSKGDHGLPQSGGAPAGGNGFGGGQSAAPANQQQSGFGGGFGGQQQGGQTAGFGGTSGFGQPPADSSGQSAANGAGTADSQSSTTNAGASPSNGEAPPAWLAQAGSGSPQG